MSISVIIEIFRLKVNEIVDTKTCKHPVLLPVHLYCTQYMELADIRGQFAYGSTCSEQALGPWVALWDRKDLQKAIKGRV